jgi:hypothetical protein
MKTHAPLAAMIFAAAAASAAAQQPTATLTWHWKNMTTGGQTPLHTGQSAAIWLDVGFSPPVGTPLPDGRVILGLASVILDLAAASDVFGTWVVTGTAPVPFPGTPELDGPGTNVPANWQIGDPVVPLHWGRRHDPSQPAGGWQFGGDAVYQPQGSVVNPPGTLAAIQAGQFPLGTEVNSFNPVRELWRGMFTPAHYTDRMLVWQPRHAEAVSGAVALYAQHPGSPITPVAVPFDGITWGSLSIPVVPSPSALGVLGFACLAGWRRRRTIPGSRS